MIERSAITVRVREPFVKWLQTLPDPVEEDMSIEALNSDPSVYLVYEMLDEESKSEILVNERLTGALLDRVTHRVHIIEANGESYRLKDAKKRHRPK